MGGLYDSGHHQQSKGDSVESKSWGRTEKTVDTRELRALIFIGPTYFRCPTNTLPLVTKGL